MAIFYTARRGLKSGEKSLKTAMEKAMDKDEIVVNQNKLDLDETVMLKGGVTISGDGDKNRPTLVAKDRQLALLIGTKIRGTITLRHLDLQLGDSGIGIRCNAKGVTLILDDVHIYHHSRVKTPYTSLLVDTAGEANVTLNNDVIDLVQADVNSLTVTKSNLGDWFSDSSKLFMTQGRFEDSALQNTLLAGHNQTSQVQLIKVALGGNVRFDSLQGNISEVALSQVPTINHRGTFVTNSEKEATSLIVGQDTKLGVQHVSQLDPESQGFKTKLDLPKWRTLGLAGGSLSMADAYLENTGLMNKALAGDLTFENVTDDSQWVCDAKNVKLSNRNSQSSLFDSQSKLDIKNAEVTGGAIKQHQNAMQKLDRMIGLTGVKKQLQQIVAQAKMNAERQRRGLATGKNQLSLNMVFAGSPGTGKTVVARLVGQALYEAGVLKSTKFIEVRQADLVGEHVGETAPKTKEKVRKALDGVLFVDEAYELAPPRGGGNTFNNEAVTELIADMENYSDRLVVIMAGYTEDMSDFFKRGNQGLSSRMHNWIEFPDYTPTELKKIERLDLEDAQARLANKQTLIAMDHGIDTILPIISRSKTAGNGRFVRNYVQKITEMRDARLATEDTSKLTDTQLLVIQPQDVTTAVNSMSKQIQDMQQ